MELWRWGRIALVPKRYLHFLSDYRKFKGANDGRLSIRWGDRQPMVHDRTSSHGFDHHYIYHTAWAARVLREIGPTEHVDISSSLYFSAIISAFVPTTFIEYRKVDIGLEGLTSSQGDILSLPLPDESVRSLSCMHVVEHIGLGRYGDPLDTKGDIRAIRELKRVLARGGDLLFVVPVGKPRVMFNAHRIYSYEQIISYFQDLELIEFALIPNRPDGGLLRQADPQRSKDAEYDCGCFWFRKPNA